MISLQKIPWMYILIPFLHSWKNGAVQPWHSSSEVMGLRLCSLLLSLDEPACLLGSCTAQTQTLLRFPWHKGRLIQRAAPWDGTVQPRRPGRAGWVALLPQSPAQSVWQVTGFSQVTHLCPCHYPAVASCWNLSFSTPASQE